MEIADPVGFLDAARDLRDLRIASLHVSPEAATVALTLSEPAQAPADDAIETARGRPDRTGTLTLLGAQAVVLSTPLTPDARIARTVLSAHGPLLRLGITLDLDGALSGEEHLAASFVAMDFRPRTTWYAASIVIALPTSDDPDMPIGFYENVMLIEAPDAQAAAAEAHRLGALEAPVHDDFTIDGRPVKPFYAGLRKLMTISNPPDREQDSVPPVSGSEISFSFLQARNRADLDRYLREEAVELLCEQ